MSTKETDPSLINSSYTIFFHAAVVSCAFLFTGTLNAHLHSFALAVNLLYGFGLFWFFYLLRQFYDENPVLGFILGFFLLSAILSFVSVVKGPLAGGEVPVLGLSFVSQKIVLRGAQTSYIYASVLISYGYMTYVSSVAVASVAEFIYTRLIARFSPPPLKRSLVRVDSRIDTLSSRFSLRFFFMNQDRGVRVTFFVLLCFVLVYVTLLVFS